MTGITFLLALLGFAVAVVLAYALGYVLGLFIRVVINGASAVLERART